MQNKKQLKRGEVENMLIFAFRTTKLSVICSKNKIITLKIMSQFYIFYLKI